MCLSYNAGGEWDYVILSTVRSLPKHSIEKNPTEGWCFRNMGFICDTHQINVALTRARMGLIIVGNYCAKRSKHNSCFDVFVCVCSNVMLSIVTRLEMFYYFKTCKLVNIV